MSGAHLTINENKNIKVMTENKTKVSEELSKAGETSLITPRHPDRGQRA